jgi:hypothetical protein
MVCTGCRSSLVVPKIEENIHPVIPPPLPIQSVSALPIPPLPPLLPPNLPLPVPPTDHTDNTDHTDDHDELAILAYVFEEKQLEKKLEKTLPQPPPIHVTSNKKEEPETKKPSSLLYRGTIISLIFLVVVGIAFFLIFCIDWRSPDSRPEILEKIVLHKNQTLVNAQHKEIESETLRLRSFELWNQAAEAIDALIVILGKNDIKQENKEKNTEQRLNDLHKMIQTAVHQAAETEINRKNTIYNAKIYRAESQFFKEQELKLQEQIRQFPNERTYIAMPVFDTENQTITAEEPIMLGLDWTENHFGQLNFPEITADRFYVAFDTVKRLYGGKSLRVTALEQKPITVSFFEKATKNNLITPEHAEYFIFSIRFPAINELLRIGNNVDIGKINALRIRFVYPSGHIDFETVSQRYCNALFYDACGTFVPVEFPLTGDFFWKRTNHVEGSKTEWNETPIDHIEICVTPLSNQTTFWLDGIMLTEKMSHEPYDLLRAEIQQTEIRNRVKEFFKLHNSNNGLNNPNDSNNPNNSNNNLSGNKISIQNSSEELPKSTGINSIRHLFQWVLQDAQGKIHFRRGNRFFSLDSQLPLPEFDEAIIIEEIDLAGFRRLTDEHLNQLSNLKTVKRLNLSRTALKNEHLIKLTTLTSLESLNLAENELTFEGLPAIRTLKQLKELNLDGIKTGLDGIDALGTLVALRSLSLSRSEMDNSDLIYLLPLAELETINLSSTKIGDKGLPIFRVFTELRLLDLSETRITDNGLASLIPLRNLRELKLNNTALSNACLKNLRKIQGLEIISVSNTAITKDGVRQEFSPAKFQCFQFTE